MNRINTQFIWFDPVNNDPHFINLLANVLQSSNIYFDVLATPRLHFPYEGKGHFVRFLPSFLVEKIRTGKKRYKALIALLYPLFLIRALMILATRKKRILYSSALWFPVMDALAIQVLKWIGKSPLIIVHRPYRNFLHISFGIKFFFHRGVRFITLSQYSKKFMINRYGIAADRIDTFSIPNFNSVFSQISENPVILQELHDWKQGRTLFLYFSGLTKGHGILDLVKIIDRCLELDKPYCFFIAGNIRNNAQRRIAVYLEEKFAQEKRVKIKLGFYQNDEAKSWLAVTDAVILPYREIAQSAVLTMVLGQGVPAIVRKVGGLHEPIISGWNGFIIEHDDVEEWFRAFESVKDGSLAGRKEIMAKSEEQSGEDTTIRFIQKSLGLD